MFGKVKQFLKKIRIFKRLREYKDRETVFRTNMQKALTVTFKLEKELTEAVRKNLVVIKIHGEEIEAWKKSFDKLTIKHDKASKHYGELINRRDEVLHRLQSEPPDNIITGGFANYKLWVAESFVKKGYKHYVAKEPHGNVFIDGDSSIRGLENIFNIIDEDKDVQKEEEKG